MNQTVRITANWEIVGQNQYLDGIHCRAEYIERLGTIFSDAQNDAIKWNVSRVQSREFDGRAKITVVGAMRDPTRGEGPALKFEIFRFEDIAPLETVRDVDFCDIVGQPQQFFGRAVRIKATWQQGHEFSYLNGIGCRTKFRHEIATGWLNSQDPNLSKMLLREYGGRAIVTAVGTLRDPGKYFGYFRYLFEVRRLEDVQHVIEPYEGTVEAGRTYRAVVRGDKEIELRLVPPLHIEFHYSAGIDWLNLSDFPELEKLHETSGERTIVFSVMSDVRRQMTERRWSRMLQIKIIRIE
ncbi:MAG TPA: hypothetical protein VFX97_14905 [Pyrinomonadaceae bacterium]|nr:hypothetical protein [Pyrinomonadaceae bacterium]